MSYMINLGKSYFEFKMNVGSSYTKDNVSIFKK